MNSNRILMEHNIPGFENVAHLDSLTETGVYAVALPMKVAQGSGAPLRIIACMPEHPCSKQPSYLSRCIHC